MTDPLTTPSPFISAEFLSGGTAAGLEKLRSRLLDLTNRNRLLNFKFAKASSLKIVDVDPDVIFERLINGEEVPFRAVPDPPRVERSRIHTDATDSAVIKPPATEYATALGWNVAIDLNSVSDQNPDSAFLPVLYYVDDFDTLSRKVASAANTAIEESGTNMLYLTFGFLEWYESDDSSQSHLAPLMTLPVAVNRNTAKGKSLEVTLERSGDDSASNLSLSEKLRRDFGIEVPTIEEDDSPATYFLKFSEILEQKKRWRIRRQLTLSLLSFGKLLMYRDLDAKVWPELLVHRIVNELFEGRKSASITHAEEHPIDSPELSDDLPQLIVDADSSQHSALVDAIRGQDLVIEGPPGTGKSQTITNLIAAALVKGKTVLFVSEKLAALEVVRRRMDSAGLGLFCLELHSHKTRKDALLTDLSLRLHAQGTFRDPKQLDDLIASAEHKKRRLSRYANLINQQIKPIDKSVFEVLWARDCSYQELPFDRSLVNSLLLPSALHFTPAMVIETEQFLSNYTQHLCRLLQGCSSPLEHPWARVPSVLSLEEQERLLDALSLFKSSKETADDLRAELSNATGIELGDTIEALKAAAETVQSLPSASAPLLTQILERCRDAKTRESLWDFAACAEVLQATLTTLSAATKTGDGKVLLRDEVAKLLGGVRDDLTALSLSGCNKASLEANLHLSRQAEQTVAQGEAAFESIKMLLGCEIGCDPQAVDALSSGVQLLEKAPDHLLYLRSPELMEEGARRTIDRAAARSEMLRQQLNALEQTYDLAQAEAVGADNLQAAATEISDAGFWGRLFGGSYRAACKTYRGITRGDVKASRASMTRDLRAIAEVLRNLNQFRNDNSCRLVLGSHFKDVETDWRDIQEIVGWCEDVQNRLGGVDKSSAVLRELLLTESSQRLKSFKAALLHNVQGIVSLQQLQELLDEHPTGPQTDIGLLKASLKSRSARIDNSLSVIALADLNPALPIGSIAPIVAAIERYREKSVLLASYTHATELLGNQASDPQTDLAPLKETLRFADAIANESLPKTAIDWLLSDEYDVRLRKLHHWLEAAGLTARTLKQSSNSVAMLIPASTWLGGEAESLHVQFESVVRALDARDTLADWQHFLMLRDESEIAHLSKLTLLADERHIEPGHLIPAFRFALYNTLAKNAFAENADLISFSGTTLDQTKSQFAQTDRQVIKLHQQRVAAIVDKRPIPTGRHTGPVKGYSELSLIAHETTKQKRHIPIRQLVLRAGSALLAMKPCFMMGPLSVAQYLEPGKLTFDLVIMDEASQLKPEDALGAVARGGQVVIVGDPKQLPPTSFFQRVALDDDIDDDDDRTAIEETESILDVASTLFQPVRRLRWHYRSRHQSLIAFSNREFYDGDLIIFPSAHHESPDLGVKYRPVPAGVFVDRRNMPEARAIVDAILAHMECKPNETLGVVALNFDQRELIEDLLDRRMKSEVFARTYQERFAAGPEPLFIKNLENVQGDERDVIFISATYGPDAKGHQFQRFGPINGPNGHRRLNVLFTRARKRTEVFSSLDPDKIQVSTNSARGLRALKDYLNYAKTGILGASAETTAEPENDFEKSVGSVLRDKGFQVVAQVGVAGFFIDLAIRHPMKAGAFLLGIECDGATYHSGRSARDRDRLREEILISQGWQIHRIWSTDWFRSRSTEISRLLRKIDELLKADPEYVRELHRQQSVVSLQTQLTKLREEIAASFPDSLAEAGLLRPIMFELFLKRRPLNRSDWFRWIPAELRSETDGKQISQYLDRVLEVIASSAE